MRMIAMASYHRVDEPRRMRSMGSAVVGDIFCQRCGRSLGQVRELGGGRLAFLIDGKRYATSDRPDVKCRNCGKPQKIDYERATW